jgi:hypothetical protein
MFKEIFKEIQDHIIAEAEKHIARHHAYHNRLALEHLREKNRLVAAPGKTVHTPTSWGANRLFNPFYVKIHARPIAFSIASRITSGAYTPHNPFIRQIPKPSGGTRDVSTFQIPDAAVSLWAYENLMRKNRHRLSSFAYAYRNDRNAHYAVQDMYIDFKQRKRLFVAEYDFSKFFDSINHTYLLAQLDENGFLVSDIDLQIIKAFISKQEVGVPQGTSISLFLANVVCWWLDHELEHLGVKFARYADDTVIWGASYDSICRSYAVIEEFSKRSGVSINIGKSKGISLVTTECNIAEFANPKEHVDFLGYKVSLTCSAIKDSSVAKIKKHIQQLLYMSLVKPITDHNWRSDRIIPHKNIDKDLGSVMHQIRRYLYGNLTEVTLKKFERGMIRKISFKGLMSYYPFVDDINQLKQLDSWLANAIFRFLHARTKLIHHAYSIPLKTFPWNVSPSDIVARFKHDYYLCIPSFLRIHNAIRLGMTHQGPFFKDSYLYTDTRA